MRIKPRKFILVSFIILLVVIFIYFLSSGSSLRRVTAEKSTVIYGTKSKEIIYRGMTLLKRGDFFYLLDSEDRSVKMFNQEFILIKTLNIKKGQGPEELNIIMGICIANNHLYIGGANEILVYGLDFNFISKIRLPIILLNFTIIGHYIYGVNPLVLQNNDKQAYEQQVKPFIRIDMNTMKKKSFGHFDMSFFRNPLDATVFRFKSHDSKLFVNPLLAPFVQIYDPRTLKLEKTVIIPKHKQYSGFSPVCFDPYGHSFIAMINKVKKHTDILCMDSEMRPMFLQEMRDFVVPVNFVINNREEIYYLSQSGTIVLKNRISLELFAMDENMPMESYINNIIPSSGYYAKRIAPHYIEKAKELGVETDSLRNSIRVFSFDRREVYFYGWFTSTSIFKYSGNTYKLITNKKYDKSVFSIYKFLKMRNSLYLIENNVVFNLNDRGDVLKKLKVNFMPGYCGENGKEVIGMDWHNNFFYFDGKRSYVILKNIDLKKRGLTSKVYYPVYDKLNNKILIFLKKQKYYFSIKLKQYIANEGNLLPGRLCKTGKIKDVVVNCNGDGILVVASFHVKHSPFWQLLVINKSFSSRGFNKILDLLLPFYFECNINQNGDLLLQFPDDRDYLILLENESKA